MKFYFGQVPQHDLENFGSEGLFYNSGNYYYYVAEFGSNPGGSEEITVTDTCGRMLPVAVDHLRELATIAVECNNIAAELEAAQELLDEIRSEVLTAGVIGTAVNYNN